MYTEDGKLCWQGALDSYGRMRMERGETGSCPFRYQGQYEDKEIGLYYNRFRYYSPEEGMYISQDPIRLAGGSKFYAYVDDTNIEVDILGLALCRVKPRMETGNLNEGWLHIEARHITGTHHHGAGDLFAAGTTRVQLESAASIIAKKGNRISDPSRTIQVIQKKVVVNGRKDLVRIIVDSHDGNRIITMFPVITGP